MCKIISFVLALSLFTQIHTLSLDQLIKLTQNDANLNEISGLSDIFRDSRGDVEVRQAATPAATPAATTPAATPAATPASTPTATPAASSSLSPLISGVITAFGNAFSPLLGPFKPLADVAGPLLNSAFTGIFTNALHGLVGVLKSNDLPNSGYDTYLVNIPDQGSYIILAKSQDKEKDVAPPAPVENVQVNRSPSLTELINNAIRESQSHSQETDAKTPLTAAAIGASFVKKKPLLIPLSLLTALVGASSLTKNQKAYSDYEIILDEN